MTLLSAPTAHAASCVVKARVWYDSDQYGTCPKAWGEITNCRGPLALRTQIFCNGTRKVNDTVSKSTLRIASIRTTTRSIGWCTGGKWTAVLTGSKGGVGFYESFVWKDWGYPV